MAIQYLRSIIYLLLMVISTCIWVIPSVLARFFPDKICFAIVYSWCTFNVFSAKLICGIKYNITGLENIPKHACLIMCNHQSTWETLALPSVFPALSWVIKKELLYVPLFGWGIASTQPIPLNRKQGKKALKQLIKDGSEKINSGRSVLIFPEGTRVPYGEARELKVGGFVLAKKTKADILPIAHDSGRLWPRHSLLKKSGTINVVIGKPISTQDSSSDDLKIMYSNWLSHARKDIDRMNTKSKG